MSTADIKPGDEPVTPAAELRAAAATLRDPIASLNNPLAEPLAELLDHVADDMDDTNAEERVHPRVDVGGWRAVHPVEFANQGPRFDWTAALATARVINGSTS